MTSAISRNSAVLYGSYCRAFVSRAITSGYASAIDVPGIDDPDALHQFDYDQSYKRNPHKTAALQMFLLFDSVHLLGADPGYDYSQLENTGLVFVTEIDDDHALLGSLDWCPAEKAYARFLKPVVIDHLVKGPSASTDNDLLREHGLKPRQFYSDLFDYWMGDEPPDVPSPSLLKALRFLKVYSESGYERNSRLWEDLGVAPADAIDRIRFVWAHRISSAVGQLMAILDASVERQGILLQNEFPMSELDALEYDLSSHKDALRSYRILRVSFEKLIHELPELKAIDDVLELKDKRAKDIARLREVVATVELGLRAGEEKALQIAEHEVSQAAAELARGNKTSKVSKWATYLSLPVTFVEMYLSLPPVLGVTTGVVGTGATLFESLASSRNGWLQVIR
jgi:hypothetical protein